MRYLILLLDFVSEEIIAEETDPAGCKHNNGKKEFDKDVEILLLEDVKDTPYCDDDT